MNEPTDTMDVERLGDMYPPRSPSPRCTPRCYAGTIHALDCPRYNGPLSSTGTLTQPEQDLRPGEPW